MSVLARPTSLPSRRRARRLAMAALVSLVPLLAACGGSSAPVAQPILTVPPAGAFDGCSYTSVNGQVSADQGVNPKFAPFQPDAAATAAWRHIKKHTGTGIVDGFNIPSGVELYAGPDTANAPVAKVPLARQMVVSDPVLWTGAHGVQWMAVFLACGGPNAYWFSVPGIYEASSQYGQFVSSTLTELANAAPFTETGHASLLPITINNHKEVTWVDKSVPFSPARGLIGAI